MAEETQMGGPRWDFTTTSWQLVSAAGDAESSGRAPALNILVAQYWKPVYHFIRHSGHSIEDAKDLTQEFFEHFLRRDIPAKADPSRGRFRWYLLSAVRNFLHDAHDRASAAKRGGDRVVPLEGEDKAAAPEDHFNREWARMMLDQGMKLFAMAYAREGRGQELLIFQRYLQLLSEDEKVSYDRLAAEFGMEPGPLGNLLFRARSKYRQILLQILRQYVASPEDAELELRDLFGTL